MPGRGKASQTDLLAICAAEHGRFVLAVEGKVDETLGPLVSEWDNGTANRRERLQGLLELLDLEHDQARTLRYQLLHRTAAAGLRLDGDVVAGSVHGRPAGGVGRRAAMLGARGRESAAAVRAVTDL